jgi:hypothetical protein
MYTPRIIPGAAAKPQSLALEYTVAFAMVSTPAGTAFSTDRIGKVVDLDQPRLFSPREAS